MNNNFDKKSIGIGFVILLSISLIIFGINYLNEGGMLNSSTMTIKIRFDDAQRIEVGNDVTMIGTKIGTVTGIEIEGNSVVIAIQVDEEFKIPIDSRYEISQESLIGSKSITIIPGKNTNVFAKSYEEMGIIDSMQPEMVSLTNDLSDFARKLNDLLTQDVKEDITMSIMDIKSTTKLIDDFVRQHKDVLSETDKENFKEILANFNEVSENIKFLISEESDQIQNTLDNFNLFSRELDPISRKLSILASHIDSMMIKINDGDGTIAKLIDVSEEYIDENGNGQYDEGEQFIDTNNNGTRDEGAELYNNANQLVLESIELVSETKNKIDGVYDNITSVTDNLNSTIDNLNALLDEFQTNEGFKKYVKLYLKADKEFKREESRKK